jgi:YL1 nuclear protein
LGSIAQERIRERRRNLGSRVALRMQEKRGLMDFANDPHFTSNSKNLSPRSHAVAARIRTRRQSASSSSSNHHNHNNNHNGTNSNKNTPSRLVRQAMERAKKERQQQHHNKAAKQQHQNTTSSSAAAAAAFDPFSGSTSDTDAEALVFSEDSLLLQQPDLHLLHDAVLTDDDMTLTSVRQIVESTNGHGHPVGRGHATKSSSSIAVAKATTRQKSHHHGGGGGGKNNNNGNLMSTAILRNNSGGNNSCSTNSGDGGGDPGGGPGVFRTKDDDTYYDDEEEEEEEEEEDAVEEEDDDVDDRDQDEDDSQGSVSYAERQRRKEKEFRRRAAAAAAAKVEGPFLVQDDVEHYRKAVDTPLSRTVVGVAVAATTGCLVLGPVGLLVGAAAVGIIVGYMQIPAEERHNMNKKASEAIHNLQDSALSASDTLSNQCASTYQNSGVADHVPLELQKCCRSFAADIEQVTHFRDYTKMPDDNITAKASSDVVQPGGEDDPAAPRTSPTMAASSRNNSTKRTKVACLRSGASRRIVWRKLIQQELSVYSHLCLQFSSSQSCANFSDLCARSVLATQGLARHFGQHGHAHRR